MIPVIVIRPEPGCGRSVAASRALGLAAHGFPLFKVRALAWKPPAPDQFDAMLVGSANVFRHGGDALAAYHDKPVHAVGETTAEAARAAGFTVASTGSGGLHSVLERAASGHRRLLRLAGRDRVVLAPPPGVSITERVVYASKPAPMPGALTDLLHEAALVLLHSGEAARHFSRELDMHGLLRERISLAAIGPRVAQEAGLGWARVEAAQAANETALLALAARMCQTPVQT